MRSDDLVPLLSAGRDKSAGYVQGTVISWDPDDASNVIEVRGSLFTDLPILNTSEASLLTAGDTVVVTTWGSSYAIMGRIVYPGTPEAVSSIQAITNRIQASADGSQGYRNSTTWGDLTGVGSGPSVTMRIGSSGRALVFWSAEMGQTTPSATPAGPGLQAQSKNTPHVSVELSGANTVAADAFSALNVNLDIIGGGTAYFWIQSAMMHVFTGLDVGDTTFTMKYKHDGETPSAAVNFQAREIAVFAL